MEKQDFFKKPVVEMQLKPDTIIGQEKESLSGSIVLTLQNTDKEKVLKFIKENNLITEITNHLKNFSKGENPCFYDTLEFFEEGEDLNIVLFFYSWW